MLRNKGRPEEAKHFLVTNSARRKENRNSRKLLEVEKELAGPMFYKNSGFPKRMSPLERHVFIDKQKVYKKTLADVSGGSKEVHY